MPLVINGLGGGHTDTHIPTRRPKQFQETRRVRPSATRTWFNNMNYEYTNYIQVHKFRNYVYTLHYIIKYGST